MKFKIEKKLKGTLARAGVIETLHGEIKTPTFVPVATQATVKALTPEQVKSTGAQAVLGNTYYLYLDPGEKIIKKAGGLEKYMGWNGPTFTDSGGFQVFSLGAAFGKAVSKIADREGKAPHLEAWSPSEAQLAKINEEGVTFRSHRDGSTHKFTPERAMRVQQSLGADIIFALDECTSPWAPEKYQKEAMDRTHVWAKRCLAAHLEAKLPSGGRQALFGIVQGGRHEGLRKESAKTIGKMDFDGFGIGGSFSKKDIGTAVRWVNEILPEEKPRHLLGIGEPGDIFLAVENGCDMFDCVIPTREARNGTLYAKNGRMNILNSAHREDLKPIELDCDCYTCKNFSRSYVAHLFRAKEMLAATLATIHNLRFMMRLTENIRESILEENFNSLKESFFSGYYH